MNPTLRLNWFKKGEGSLKWFEVNDKIGDVEVQITIEARPHY